MVSFKCEKVYSCKFNLDSFNFTVINVNYKLQMQKLNVALV